MLQPSRSIKHNNIKTIKNETSSDRDSSWIFRNFPQFIRIPPASQLNTIISNREVTSRASWKEERKEMGSRISNLFKSQLSSWCWMEEKARNKSKVRNTSRTIEMLLFFRFTDPNLTFRVRKIKHRKNIAQRFCTFFLWNSMNWNSRHEIRFHLRQNFFPRFLCHTKAYIWHTKAVPDMSSMLIMCNTNFIPKKTHFSCFANPPQLFTRSRKLFSFRKTGGIQPKPRLRPLRVSYLCEVSKEKKNFENLCWHRFKFETRLSAFNLRFVSHSR